MHFAKVLACAAIAAQGIEDWELRYLSANGSNASNASNASNDTATDAPAVTSAPNASDANATTVAPNASDANATTVAPATDAPNTTAAPATDAPNTTAAPATDAPATEAPSSGNATTAAPATEAPSSGNATTAAPATDAPVTEAPVTEAPVTEAPATAGVPSFIANSTETGTTDLAVSSDISGVSPPTGITIPGAVTLDVGGLLEALTGALTATTVAPSASNSTRVLAGAALTNAEAYNIWTGTFNLAASLSLCESAQSAGLIPADSMSAADATAGFNSGTYAFATFADCMVKIGHAQGDAATAVGTGYCNMNDAAAASTVGVTHNTVCTKHSLVAGSTTAYKYTTTATMAMPTAFAATKADDIATATTSATTAAADTTKAASRIQMMMIVAASEIASQGAPAGMNFTEAFGFSEADAATAAATITTQPSQAAAAVTAGTVSSFNALVAANVAGIEANVVSTNDVTVVTTTGVATTSNSIRMGVFGGMCTLLASLFI